MKNSFLILVLVLCVVNTPGYGSEDALVQTLRGKEVFNRKCAACHQKDGRGLEGLAPSINNAEYLTKNSDEDIRKTIVEGRPQTVMVSFKSLGDEDIDALIKYIRLWQEEYEQDKS